MKNENELRLLCYQMLKEQMVEAPAVEIDSFLPK